MAAMGTSEINKETINLFMYAPKEKTCPACWTGFRKNGCLALAGFREGCNSQRPQAHSKVGQIGVGSILRLYGGVVLGR
jgi:hypothetical protein